MSILQFTEAELSMMRMHYLQEYNSTLKKLEELSTMLQKLGISSDSKSKPVSLRAVKEQASAATAVAPKKRGRKPGSKKISAPVKSATPEVEAAPKRRGRPAKAKPEVKAPALKAKATVKAKAAKVTKTVTPKVAKAAKPAVKAKATKAVKAVAPKVAKAPKGKKISWAKFVVNTLLKSPTPMSAPELLHAGTDQFAVTDANRIKSMQALQAALFRLSKKTGKLDSEKTKGSYIGYFVKKK